MKKNQQETFAFQAEVGKLLDIVAHSLYSQKEVFLRELISNASDACDKLRYEALTNPSLLKGDGEFKVTINPDKKNKILTISDNGIGMSRGDLIESLGTIARSGTQAFIEHLTEKAKNSSQSDIGLIGQFGVGFYSAFMVADKVDVLTRKCGEKTSWLWTSDGQGEFCVEAANRESHGTDVTVHLKKTQQEFLDIPRIENIVKRYSDHIGVPIVLKSKEKSEDAKTLNTASALWTREKKAITKEQYKEFYHHVAHVFDDPWLTIHNRVEGVSSYTNLLFIPSTRPFDLFNPERKSNLKLYVNRVFITDNAEHILPGYLRFTRGIIDSEDLDLNVSRELLQMNPAIERIKKGLIKRILNELKKKAEKAPEDYTEFWENFGMVLKEGIHEDFENRKNLIELSRFNSSKGDKITSLASYVEGMVEGQNEIYYITGEDVGNLRESPQLEGFKEKNVEVLFMTDPVDEFWLPAVGEYESKKFKSITKGNIDLSELKQKTSKSNKRKDADSEKTQPDVDSLIGIIKVALGEAVKNVVSSKRLTDSACCLVADENAMDMNLERLLKQHNQLEDLGPRILEINPKHPLIKGLAKIAAKKGAKTQILHDASHLLFDQARIVEGEPVADPRAFVKRMSDLMVKGLTN
ncbi:MAG: Chaperone protein HtpG [Alphaproteobacteria bacterium MarineAlpha3_Bin5]|nr:molecular chaperone HtpG [Magnetovibrio sp.]PPR77420.1 MAG: Chaperone protein HtpG [Alphaproteobacteria bacterium MarineAlpha3_Bin5]